MNRKDLKRLWEATNYALKRFREAGFEIGATESPIIPLYVRDTEKTFHGYQVSFRRRCIHQSGYSAGMCTARHFGARGIDGYSHQRTNRPCCRKAS